jgi:SPP1 family phage portal protein
MTTEEIFRIEDIGQRIIELKKRNTPLPDLPKLWSEWNPASHDVMRKETRPKRKVLVEESKIVNGKEVEAKYAEEEVNRISVPFQQDIVNIQAAFTVGRQPDLHCEPNDNKEEVVFKVIQSIEKDNKIKFINKKVVRAWMSETEVAEYWYAVEDLTFWKKIAARTKKANLPYIENGARYKLRCKVFSPFSGDTLFPLFDHLDNLIAFSREYSKRENNIDVRYFQVITDNLVDVYKMNGAGWERVEQESFAHGFGKIPVIYMRRKDGPVYEIVSPIIKRVENLLSDFAECIDHHFFPKTIIKGEVRGVTSSEKSHTVKIDGDADIRKLTWQQAPDNIKLELETHIKNIYSRTQTPDVSFENLKGIGIQSGKAFRYVYMGAHMSVENHAEDVELFLQRRYNFIITAIGKLNTAYEDACDTIEITPCIVPYMIDDVEADVNIALRAGGGEAVASRRTVVKLAKLVDNVENEVKEIEKDQEVKLERNRFDGE